MMHNAFASIERDFGLKIMYRVSNIPCEERRPATLNSSLSSGYVRFLRSKVFMTHSLLCTLFRRNRPSASG